MALTQDRGAQLISNDVHKDNLIFKGIVFWIPNQKVRFACFGR